MHNATNIEKLLNWRYAVRRFSSEKVQSNVLEQLLHATRLSASSYGIQPYKILVVNKQGLKEQLVGASYNQRKIAENSHLLVIAANMENIGLQIDNYIQRMKLANNLEQSKLAAMAQTIRASLLHLSETERYQWASQQAYVALGTLLISAASYKVDTCPVGGIEHHKYDEILGLKEKQLKTVIACPIGYREAGDAIAKNNKVRLTLGELVMEVN